MDGSIQSNPGIQNFDFSLTLAAPNPDTDHYGNIVSKVSSSYGESSIDVISKVLGKDTIVGADLESIKDLSGSLSIAVLVGMQGSLAAQKQLENINPSQPDVPIITELVQFSAQLLNNGDLGGVTVNLSGNVLPNAIDAEVSEDEKLDIDGGQGTTGAGGTGGAGGASGGGDGTITEAAGGGFKVGRSTGGPGGAGVIGAGNVTVATVNRWLAGNAYTQFLQVFSELARLLMQVKEVQGMIELNSMKQIVALAVDAAASIMAAARMEQAKDIAAAVCSGLAMGMSLISIAGMAKSLKSFEKEPTVETDLEFRSSKADTMMLDRNSSQFKAAEARVPRELNEQELVSWRNDKIDAAKGNPAEVKRLEDLYGKRANDTLSEPEQKLAQLTYENERSIKIKQNIMDDLKTQRGVDADNKSILVNKQGHTSAEVAALNSKLTNQFQLYQAISQVGQSGSQTVTSAVNAAYDLPIAVQQGLQKMIDATSTIIQHQLQTSTEAFKANTDLIEKLYSNLDSMRDKLTQAVQASLGAR